MRPPPFLANLQHVARTDVGMRRANNQDSHKVLLAEDEQTWRSRGHIFMVADGMGAHAAGELASKLAVDNVPHLYLHHRNLPPVDSLRNALTESNNEIHRRGLANADFRAMGTTASVLVLLPQGALVAHVGDSRVYRLRHAQLEQLTFDHSLQWELRSMGRLPEGSDLARSIPKNVITRSLGPNAEVAVDTEGFFPLEVGDTFLLCSDGLSGQVRDDEIASLLSYLAPDEAAATLVDLANLRGGPDNITLIIAKIIGDGLPTSDAADFIDDCPVENGRRAATSSTAWIVTGVCLLLAFLFWFAERPGPAVLTAAAGLGAALWGTVSWIRGGRPEQSTAAQAAALGKAPYASVRCAASEEFSGTLVGILRELREAAEEEQWEIHWPRLAELQQTAETACDAGDHSRGVRKYAQAISFMMDELRQQQKRKAGDSSIEY
jgi:protein phosphatase